MRVSWKAFWAAVGATAALAWAVLCTAAGVALWVSIPSAAAGAVVFSLVASRVVHGSPGFEQAGLHAQDQITRLVALAAAVHALWVVLFVARPDLWLWWLPALAALGGLTYGLARGHEYLMAGLKPASVTRDARAAEKELRDVDKIARVFVETLALAKLDRVQVRGWEPVARQGRDPHGVTYHVQLPPVGSVSGKGRDLTKLGPGDAEPIAIALAKLLGVQVKSDWVQIRKQPGAGEYAITVVTEDVMAEVIPFIDTPDWTSITTPALVGYELEGTPHFMRLDQHGEDVGKTRSGKTSLINVKWAHITRCADAVLWIGGVQKLYDSLAGWLEPYAGTDEPLPFNRIANGQSDTVTMLAAAMAVARWRQRQPMSRRKWPTIIVWLDEASFVLRNRTVRVVFEGQELCAAELAAMLRQGAGSANVWLCRASQRSTFDHGGDEGGDTWTNAGYVGAFASNDTAEIGRTMGDYDLPTPRCKGEYWLLPDGEDPVRLKAPYIQEVDPSKPRLHDGPTVSDVAWQRRRFHIDLDAGSEAVADATYQNRYPRMDDALMRYLTGVPAPAAEQGMSAAEQSGYEQVMAMYGRGRREITQPVTAAAPGPDVPGVTTLEGRTSRTERVMEILRGSPCPMSPDEVLAALHESGDTAASAQVVLNILSKLVAGSRAQRPERGRYLAQ